MKVFLSSLPAFLVFGKAFGRCANSTHADLEIRFDFNPPHFFQVEIASLRNLQPHWYYAEAPFNETYQLCAPRNECLVSTMWGTHPDDFTIQFDGESVAPGLWSPDNYSYRGRTTTEIGPCVPECQDDQQLLEIVYYSGTDTIANDFVVYAQAEEATAEHHVVFECLRYRGSSYNCAQSSYEFYFYRNCVDTDNFCHHFVSAARFFQKQSLDDKENWQYYNVSLDGTQIHHVDAAMFSSFSIGTACEDATNVDKTVCREDESLLETFIYRNFDNDITGFADLRYFFQISKDEKMALEGVFPGNATRELHYQHQCVAKDSCLLFNAGIPPDLMDMTWSNGDVRSYNEHGSLRVSLDGVLFVDEFYRFREGHSDGDPPIVDLGDIYVGNNCLAADVCAGDALGSVAQVQMDTTGVEDVHTVEDCFWRVDHYENKYAHSYKNFQWDLLAGKVFRHVFCLIPKECQHLELGCEKELPLGVEFTVSVDGNTVAEDSECPEFSVLSSIEFQRRYSLKECPPRFSPGAITGMVIGGLTGLALVFGVVQYIKYSRRNSEFTVDEDPEGTGTVVSKEDNIEMTENL